jgi:hypothetical protein
MRSYKAQLLGVEVEVLEFDEGVETVERASRASGAPPDAIVRRFSSRPAENTWSCWREAT